MYDDLKTFYYYVCYVKKIIFINIFYNHFPKLYYINSEMIINIKVLLLGRKQLQNVIMLAYFHLSITKK